MSKNKYQATELHEINGDGTSQTHPAVVDTDNGEVTAYKHLYVPPEFRGTYAKLIAADLNNGTENDYGAEFFDIV
jgi:hypothetical protein